MTECSLHEGLCSHEPHCGVRAPWQRISRVVERALRDVSLAQMIGAGPPPAGAPLLPGRIAVQVQS